MADTGRCIKLALSAREMPPDIQIVSKHINHRLPHQSQLPTVRVTGQHQIEVAGASKAALVCVTQGLARALAPTVRVNGVSPGIAVFPDHYSAAERRRLTRQVPLKRAGTPSEVARLVGFLAKPGGYVTGQVIAIDGGRSIS